LWSRCFKTAPRDGRSKRIIQLAEHAFWVGDYASAIDYYLQYMSQDPGLLFRYRTYLRLGYAYKFTGEIGKAEECFLKLDKIVEEAAREYPEYRKMPLEEAVKIAPAEEIEAILLERLVSTTEVQRELTRARRTRRGKELLLERNDVFTYSMSPQFLQWEARAYSTRILDLNRITMDVAKVISKQMTSVYGEFEDASTHFVVRSEGVAFLITSWVETGGINASDRLRWSVKRLAEALS